MLILNNVETADAYPATGAFSNASALGPSALARELDLVIGNASVDVQFILPDDPSTGITGGWHFTESITYSPTTIALKNVFGFRMRSHTAATPARIFAQLWEIGDPEPLGAVPFTQTIDAQGQASTTGGSGVALPGDILWTSAIATTRDGCVPADGTFYDSVADPTFGALYAAIGVTYGGTGPAHFAVPDLQGRVMVGIGTHTEVASLGLTEGLAVGSRTPRHTSTVVDPTHSHACPIWDTGTTGGLVRVNRGNNGGTNDLLASFISAASTGITVGPAGTRPADTVPFATLKPWVSK